MKENQAGTKSGISLLSLVGLTFIILKLCKVIAWSWWWVLLPFWFPFAIAGALIIVFGLFKIYIKLFT